MLNPTTDQLASEYAGRVEFAKMNIDENSLIASQYGVKGVPTLLFFKGGELVTRRVGLQPKEAIARQLEAIA